MLDSCIISCISVTAANTIISPEKSIEVWRQMPKATVDFFWRSEVMEFFYTCSETVCFEMYCECFKCLLGCSFSVTLWVQMKSRTRNRLLVAFDDVHMKCRSDLTIVTGACEFRTSGPLAGGDGVLMGSQRHFPLLCGRIASLGFL